MLIQNSKIKFEMIVFNGGSPKEMNRKFHSKKENKLQALGPGLGFSLNLNPRLGIDVDDMISSYIWT